MAGKGGEMLGHGMGSLGQGGKNVEQGRVLLLMRGRVDRGFWRRLGGSRLENFGEGTKVVVEAEEVAIEGRLRGLC